MQLVLGVRGISKGEIDLLRTILRLSSDLSVQWAVSECQPGDVLLVNGDPSRISIQATSQHFLIVPIVPRRTDAERTGPSLGRPIYAEELVALLNGVAARVQQRSEHTASDRARRERAKLKRWPSQKVLAQNAAYLRLASAMTKRPHNAASLTALSNISEDECIRFLELLDVEHALVWPPSEEAPAYPSRSVAIDPRPIESWPMVGRGLLARIRRRLGLQ